MTLNNFLIHAKINTYATSGEGDENILEDGSKELNFEQDEFRYRDRYFGSNPFIGEEVVWQGDKIVWGMNYYGLVTSDILEPKKVYQFLKIALKKVTPEKPFRGPNNFKSDNFEYTNNCEGDINIFKGEEIIKYKNQIVYKLYYHGGKM